MTLVQKLRERLELVVRYENVDICFGMPSDAVEKIWHFYGEMPLGGPRDWRVMALSHAIRAAVVTREAQS